MAQELYMNATFIGNVTAATLMRTYALALGERDASLLLHPTVQASWEDYSGINAAVVEELPILSLGLDLLTARNEGQAAANIEPGSTSVTPTVGRFSGRFLWSGIAKKRGMRSALTVPVLSSALITGAEQTLINAIAAQFPSITAQRGVSGAQLTVARFKSACDLVRRYRPQGTLVSVLKPYQFEDMSNDGIILGGSFQRAPEAQRMIGGLYGVSYQGRFLDGQVDIYTSDQVDTVGGVDYSGCVFAPGAFAIRTEAPPESISADVVAQAGWTRIESDRNASEDDDMLIAHAYLGVTIAQQVAACEIISRIA
jgi:hypothetical protein